MNLPAAEPRLPYRGAFGDRRPSELARLALPTGPMPSHQGSRPLKAWRYVGVYGPELMMCFGAVRIGRARQAFWAIWDRANARLRERTTLGAGGLRFERGRVRLLEPAVQVDLRLAETAGIESVCTAGRSYAWTRKQAGVLVHGRLMLDGEPRTVQAFAVIDDTAAYYARRTSWRWSAGVGTARDGSAVAWNLAEGVNDPPIGSERTVWIDGQPHEVGPVSFDEDLGGVEQLRFTAEAVRERRENLLVMRSSYRQPFGVFAGELPGGPELAEGYVVMEAHDARW